MHSLNQFIFTFQLEPVNNFFLSVKRFTDLLNTLLLNTIVDCNVHGMYI